MRSFGFGSSIFRITALQARGERLLIVGGQDDCADAAELQAEAYAAKSGSVGWATVHGNSWKCRQ